jgi:hypothetical protein
MNLPTNLYESLASIDTLLKSLVTPRIPVTSPLFTGEPLSPYVYPLRFRASQHHHHVVLDGRRGPFKENPGSENSGAIFGFGAKSTHHPHISPRAGIHRPHHTLHTPLTSSIPMALNQPVWYGQPRQGGDDTSCNDTDEDLVKNHPIRPIRPIVTELQLPTSDCQHPVDDCPFGLTWFTLVTTLQFFIRLSILVSHPSSLPANDIPSTRCPPFIGTYTVGSTAEAPATADPMVRSP